MDGIDLKPGKHLDVSIIYTALYERLNNPT